MGSLNNGSQVLQFNYKAEGISKGFNIINHKIHPRGIYSGGNFSRVSDTSITLSPTLLFFEETTKSVGVRIETTTNATINVLPTTPYIIGRYTWINTENNYMDFMAIAEYDIETTDIIFGRLIFNGSVLTTDYDYSKKQWSYNYYNSINEVLPPFKVEAQEPYDNTVLVHPGKVFFGGKVVQLTVATSSPTFTLPNSSGSTRIDVVYLNNDSTIGIFTNYISTSQLSNHQIPIAVVTIPDGATQIQGNYIEYINPNIYKGGNGGNIIGSTFNGNTLRTDTKSIAFNPMTTQGDIIYGETSGVETRLPIGNTGQILSVASGVPTWEYSPPIGSIIMTAANTPPTGWLLCNGQAVSRVTYANLFTEIGTTYGIGDGVNTFNIPDMREASPYGAGTYSAVTGTTHGSITAHDVLALGAFADDRMQGFICRPSSGNILTTGAGSSINGVGSWANVSSLSPQSDGTNGTPRTGITTRGKILGLNFIIKY